MYNCTFAQTQMICVCVNRHYCSLWRVAVIYPVGLPGPSPVFRSKGMSSVFLSDLRRLWPILNFLISRY